MTRRFVRGHRLSWPGRPTGDTGSLALAMLLILVGVLLTTAILPLVLGQLNSSRKGMGRSVALHSAQAGLDVALAQIRAAVDTSGDGVASKLPCGPLSGPLGGGGTGQYRVTIRYYAQDPKTYYAPPRTYDSPLLETMKIPCVPGAGTSVIIPAFALLYSTGESTADVKTLEARALHGTYTFQTTNANIAGGLIHVHKTATSTDLCLDAGTTPIVGTTLRMQVCNEAKTQQAFAYNQNLTITLVSNGMCLGTGNPRSTGMAVQLQLCTTTSPTRQQWSHNSNANFEGTKTNKDLDGFCFNVQNPNTVGSNVVLGSTAASTCYAAARNTRETFLPDAAVGAGAAGPLTDQLVNYRQFGRCLDLPDGDGDYPYIIAWPCKQAVNPADVGQNQKWTPVTIGGKVGIRVEAEKPQKRFYCMKSSLSIASNRYVTLDLCPTTTLPTDMTWTMSNNTGTYATSYRIMDSSGLCLIPRDQDAVPPDYHSDPQISKIQMATCSDSTLQKWNAPPQIVESNPIKDILEP